MIQEQIMRIVRGNQGALRVCCALYVKYGYAPLDQLEAQGIQSSNVWLLYKDECGEDYETMAAILASGTAYATIRSNPDYVEYK